KANHVINVFGDGVALGQGTTSKITTNTIVDGNSIDGTGRMGVSLTSDDNVQVTNNTFDRVAYTVVDIENEAQQLTNITISGNITKRFWLGFIFAASGACLPRGKYTFNNNVMLIPTANTVN